MVNTRFTPRPDPRRRSYHSPERLVWSAGLENGECWIGCPEIQVLPPDGAKSARMAPGGAALIDFGCELHGGVRIVNLGTGGMVRLRFGESASEAMGAPDQDHTIHDAVLQVPVFGALEYGTTAFRFVRIDNLGDKALDLINVLAVSLMRDVVYSGKFESSDERLNAIWRTGAYTVELNMQEYIFDGVKRDRAVWRGDLHPEARCALAVFEDPSLVMDSLDFLLDRIPFPRKQRFITSYACWSVITMADYYRATGDFGRIAKHRDYLIELFKEYQTYIADDGSEKLPERRFLDWPDNRDEVVKHAGFQGIMRWMMLDGAMLFAALGEDNAPLLAAAAKLALHVPECGDNKAAAALLTLGGIADRREVLERNPFRGVSTFFGFYELLAKPTTSALELIRRYWGAMLDFGATSFWEEFDLDWCKNALPITELPRPGKTDIHADFGDFCYKGWRRSLCHGWACGPTPFLSERVLGIKFLTPGGTKVAVSPDLGDLEYVRGSIATPHGPITVTAEAGKPPVVDAPGGIEINIKTKTQK